MNLAGAIERPSCIDSGTMGLFSLVGVSFILLQRRARLRSRNLAKSVTVD